MSGMRALDASPRDNSKPYFYQRIGYAVYISQVLRVPNANRVEQRSSHVQIFIKLDCCMVLLRSVKESTDVLYQYEPAKLCATKDLKHRLVNRMPVRGTNISDNPGLQNNQR